MPFYLLHVGTTLKKMSPDGTISALTLPGTVTVSSSVKMRTAVLNRKVMISAAPSRNLLLTPTTMTLYELSCTKPASVPTLAAGAAGLLKGTYRYRVSYCVKVSGSVVTESPMSDVAGPLSVAAKKIDLSSIPTSGTYYRRLYRTTNDGASWYNIVDIDDNSTTTYTDNFSDYDLQLLEAYDISGAPPGSDGTDYFKLLTSWKDRIWGVPNLNPDRLHFCEIYRPYQWPESNFYGIKPVGGDEHGVTALMNRRDELGVAKWRSLWKIIGDSPSNFQTIQVNEGVGCVSQDSVVIVRDRAYFLHEDGVFEWGPEGLTNISREKVHPWFATDTYFNRTLFSSSFAKWNPKYDTYELHLAAAGSSNIDRWVSYDLQKRQWLGPHLTSAFTPTCGGLMDDANNLRWPVVGASNGFIYKQNQSGSSDVGTAIAMDLIPAWHRGEDPDVHHYWGDLTVLTKIEAAGTLTITPKVGGLDAAAQAAISHDLTLGRQRLRRIGAGRLMQLRFQNSQDAQAVELYGYELPFHPLGRR